MKKILSWLILLFILSASNWSYGATWYAVAGTTPNFDAVSGTTISSVWCSVDDDEDCSGGSWLDWSTAPATNDIFEASAIDGIVVNIDPKGTAGATKVHLKNTAGGFYSYATASNLTLSVDVTAGTADCLMVSGTTGGGTIGISGSHFTGSSGTTGADAIADSHTTVTVNYVGHAVGVRGNGLYLNSTSGAAVITGDCQGSDHTGALVVGCRSADTSTLKVIGNLLNGQYGTATVGRCLWEPGPTNYILFPADTSYDPDNAIDAHAIVAGPVADGSSWTNSNTLTTEAEIKTGKYIGTALGTMSSSGSGGAWGF